MESTRVDEVYNINRNPCGIQSSESGCVSRYGNFTVLLRASKDSRPLLIIFVSVVRTVAPSLICEMDTASWRKWLGSWFQHRLKRLK